MAKLFKGKARLMSFADFAQTYATEEICREKLYELRAAQGFACPKCGGELAQLENRNLLQCDACQKQTPLTAGTWMEGSGLKLRAWFLAAYLAATDHSLTPAGLAKQAGGSLKNAHILLKRTREAMQEEGREIIGGILGAELGSIRAKGEPEPEPPKLMRPNTPKRIIAAVMLGALAVYHVYDVVRQIVKLLQLKEQFAELGNSLGGLASLLGGGAATAIPSQLYWSVAWMIIGALVLVSTYAVFLFAPKRGHRVAALALLAVYELQAGLALLNGLSLQNLKSIVMSIVPHTQVTAVYALGALFSAYFVLLIGACIPKRPGMLLEWLAALVSFGWMAQALITADFAALAEAHGRTVFFLGVGAQAALAVALLLHPVLKEPVLKRD